MENADLYGHIVAGHLDSGLGYIVPAYQIFEDIHNRIEKTLALVQKPLARLPLVPNPSGVTSTLEGSKEIRKDWKFYKKEENAAGTDIAPVIQSDTTWCDEEKVENRTATERQMSTNMSQRDQYSAQKAEIYNKPKFYVPPSVQDEYQDNRRAARIPSPPMSETSNPNPPSTEPQTGLSNVSDELIAHLTERITKKGELGPIVCKHCKAPNLPS
jgi:hypothetical protein